MPRELSPHALTIITLVNNAADLSIRHHEYVLARDVMRATEKLCGEFGFDIDSEIFRYIVESIGRLPPLVMSKQFEKLALSVQVEDYKLNKDQIANDWKQSTGSRDRSGAQRK